MASDQDLRAATASPPADNCVHHAAAWPSLSASDWFARVVAASPTALVMVRQNGRIQLINHQAERVFGYTQNEVQGQPLELLMPGRFRVHHADLRQVFLTSMSSRAMGEGLDLYGLRKDGSEFPVEIGLNPIDLNGESMVLASVIDITVRRQIEREKEQQRHELQRSNADLEEFAYVASHDLKAPLRAIAHLTQWISDDVAPTASAETQQNLKLLNGRVARLQMLLDGLLAYARVDATQTTVTLVDTAALVRDIVEVLDPPLGFSVECDGAMPVLRTQRAPLERVLDNLISNAIKHHDRREGRVVVSGRMVDGVAEFRVSDDGPGILPRFHDRIFAIFQTLVRRDEHESSGIGLAIVKKKVESRGGRVWIESAPPVRGTTFVFTWKEAAP
jgi:PAS domain S-box-containing protein